MIIIVITSCNLCTARAYTTHLSFMREQPTLAAKERSLYDLSNIIDRLGYPVSDIEIGIGGDDVTIECVDVIVSHIARLCGVLNTRDTLAVSRKY